MECNIPERISRNFLFQEFVDASEVEVAFNMHNVNSEPLLVYLVPWLQAIRDKFGEAIKITSFARRNLGVENSAHFKDMAVDFTIPSFNGNLEKQGQVFNYVESLNPKMRIAWYTANETREHFYHMDCGLLYLPDIYSPWVEIVEE